MVVVDLEVQKNREDTILEDAFLTIKDLQSILKIGKDKAYKLANTKGFPSIKIGNTIRVPKDKFDEWVETYTYTTFNI